MASQEVKDAVGIVRKAIKDQRPGGDWWLGGRDMVGHRINVHYDDGEFAATVNYETYEWNSYDVVDEINVQCEALELPVSVEYLSDYEVGIEEME